MVPPDGWYGVAVATAAGPMAPPDTGVEVVDEIALPEGSIITLPHASTRSVGDDFAASAFAGIPTPLVGAGTNRTVGVREGTGACPCTTLTDGDPGVVLLEDDPAASPGTTGCWADQYGGGALPPLVNETVVALAFPFAFGGVFGAGSPAFGMCVE